VLFDAQSLGEALGPGVDAGSRTCERAFTTRVNDAACSAQNAACDLARFVMRRAAVKRISSKTILVGCVAGLGLLSGCATSADLVPPTQTAAANGWTKVVQDPMFSVELPGKPVVSMTQSGFLGQVRVHELWAATGNTRSGVIYLAPAAGWNTAPERVRNEVCSALTKAKGVHVVTEERSANGKTCTGLLGLDAQSEIAGASSPTRARFLGVVLSDLMVVLLSVTPVHPSPDELAVEEHFLRSLDDAPGRLTKP
jgi:hypothetical protein